MTEILIWSILFILFVVVETSTAQLVSIWFALGSLITLFVSLFTDNIILQIVIFIIVSIISLLCTRPFVKNIIKLKHEKTNVDTFVGKEGVVVNDIDNIKSCGRILISGLTWNARSVDDNTKIPKDSIVIVKEIKGVTAFVEKIN